MAEQLAVGPGNRELGPENPVVPAVRVALAVLESRVVPAVQVALAATLGFRNSRFVSRAAIGIALMTVSFFLTLGLLQRFDLSYLYPFQGLSVIFITLTAAIVLKEKLSLRLIVGAVLISAGIVLVSMS